MAISEQKLNEILAGIISNYGKKGSISTNALCDIMEKYDTDAEQIDNIYKLIGEAGIQIVDEEARDRELFEQALSDIGLDDPVKMYLKDIGRVPLLSAEEEVDLAKRMQKAAKEEKLYREQPFVLGISADKVDAKFPKEEKVLIQGIVDAYFEEENEIIVVDYKTDSVKSGEELVKRYKEQLNYYEEALEKLTGKKVKEKILYSFALNETIVVE